MECNTKRLTGSEIIRLRQESKVTSPQEREAIIENNERIKERIEEYLQYKKSLIVKASN